MFDFLLDLDHSIFLFLNSHHSPFLDTFMYMFSGKWIWVPLYASLMLMIWKTFGTKRTVAIIFGVTMLIVLADQTCATLIRPMVQRLRPSNLENPISAFVHIVNGHRGGAYGFPSCHAANTFALATFISRLTRTPRLTRLMFGWAILTAYSRIYLGVHFTGDLIVGGLIGSAYAVLIYYALRYTVLRNADTYNRTALIFTYPAGGLSTVMRLETINFRYCDVVSTVGLCTVLYIMVAAF